MNTQKHNNLASIKIGTLSGVISITAILISSLFTLDSQTKSSGNLLTTILTFGILISAILFCIKWLQKINQREKFFIRQFAIVGIFFSLTIGVIGGLIHYIDANFIDTQFATNALKDSQHKWEANNYSKKTIGAQIELTDTFQNPWKWAVTSGIFISIISFSLFVCIGFFNNVMHIRTKKIRFA